MYKIRRNDTIQVIAGKDKGKRGKVLRISSAADRAIVEGINLVKKHRRRTQQEQQGGITQIPSPIQLSNLMLICKNCNKPVRAGFKLLKDKSKTRICKKCGEPI
jgi:large subunit ribosomal protein L24